MENSKSISKTNYQVSTIGKSLQEFSAAINDHSNHAAVIKSLATNITDAMNKIPIKTLINTGTELQKLEQVLAVLILKYSTMLNMHTNLQSGQPLEIAKWIVEEFPYQSLDDFNVILMNGFKGRYGNFTRFDVSILLQWTEKYIDDYYTRVEQEVKSTRENESDKPLLTPEQSANVDKLLTDYLQQLAPTHKVPPITTQEIKSEGQEQPKKKSHVSSDERVVWLSEMKRVYGVIHADPKTGIINKGAPTFDFFLKTCTFEEWKMNGNRVPI
jgi:hypothetical protein